MLKDHYIPKAFGLEVMTVDPTRFDNTRARRSEHRSWGQLPDLTYFM